MGYESFAREKGKKETRYEIRFYHLILKISSNKFKLQPSNFKPNGTLRFTFWRDMYHMYGDSNGFIFFDATIYMRVL